MLLISNIDAYTRSNRTQASNSVPLGPLIFVAINNKTDFLAMGFNLHLFIFTFQCELYHWADVLDIFDGVLEKACKKETDKSWTLACDQPGNEEVS